MKRIVKEDIRALDLLQELLGDNRDKEAFYKIAAGGLIDKVEAIALMTTEAEELGRNYDEHFKACNAVEVGEFIWTPHFPGGLLEGLN